ncbi:hypothetical protein CSQ89_18915 [Chitinimonas sp. BJB300]|nr:hypothetical protein CSQ89_18915 [Chitinimonas sp. BJB300]
MMGGLTFECQNHAMDGRFFEVPNSVTGFVWTLASQPGLTRMHLVSQQTVFRGALQTVAFEIRAQVLAAP